MSDSMSEYMYDNVSVGMPDRMPELLSDTMSSRLPHEIPTQTAAWNVRLYVSLNQLQVPGGTAGKTSGAIPDKMQK